MGPQEPNSAPFTPPNGVPSAPPTPTPIQPMQPMQPQQPIAQPFQPAPQPMQPQPQPVSQPFQQFPAGPVPAIPPKPAKSKKGLILGLIIGGGVLLLAIVALVLWLTLFTVTKQDYQAAADKYAEIGDTLDDISSSSGSSLPANFSEKIDEFGKKTKEMGDLKAVKNDKDIKAAYDKVYALVPDYVKKSHTLVKVYNVIKDTCSSTNLSQQSRWQACIDDLGSFDAEGWDSLDKFLKAFKNLMQDYIDGKSANSSAYYDALSDYNDDLKKINNEMKDASSKLKDAINAKLK